MALDRNHLEAALARAADLDADRSGHSGFNPDDVTRLGAELGISSVSLTQALAEQSAGQALTLSTSAVLDGGRDDVLAELDTYFRLRGLVAGPSGVWAQRDGWWPDVYRVHAPTPVAVAAGKADDPGGVTSVTLTAGIDRIWRVHVLGGILGFLGVLVLTIPMMSYKNILVALLLATLLPVTSVWSYQRRRLSIEERLGAALEEIARPSYQLQPW